MKNKKVGRSFGRVKRKREALVHSLVEALVLHGEITTTVTKAKELKRVMDPYINAGKQACESDIQKVRSLRNLNRNLSTIAAQKLCDKAFTDIFQTRTSGYTRVVRIGPRDSDGVEMAVIKFV